MPGIYVLTGDQGAYQLGGTTFRYAGTPLAESEGLPSSFGESQLDSIINGAK